MARGNTDLSNQEYDDYLTQNKKEKALRERHLERRIANKGFEGWHFGLGDKPVYTKDKEAFKRELEKRGLVMKDDVKRELR